MGFLDPDTMINQEGKGKEGFFVKIFRVPSDNQLM